MVTDEERAELRRLVDGIQPVNGMVSQTAYLAFAEAAETAVPALLYEVERLERERDEARADYRFMVERAAEEKLDGYRELGARAAKAENERDSALADAAQLRLRVSDLKLALGDGAGWFDRCMAAERERDALRAWAARAREALALTMIAMPADCSYACVVRATEAAAAVLADAPKEKP